MTAVQKNINRLTGYRPGAIRVLLLSHILLLIIAAMPAVVAIAGLPEGDTADGDFSRLLEQLESSSFSVRRQALESLKAIPADQIELLGPSAQQHHSADVAARIVETLEYHYLNEDYTIRSAASLALESLVNADRQLIAEHARNALDRNWRIRIDLAAEELVKFGAILKRDDLEEDSPLRGWRSGSSRSLKVILTEDWHGGEQGLDVFRRMVALLGPHTFSYSGLSVFLIDGHTLTDEEVNELKNLLGDTRIAPRGKVVLGITGMQQAPGNSEGCLIDEVEPFGSAHSAGLEPGDLITDINGTGIEDFRALVTQLKQYDVNDVLDVKVVRNYRGQLYNNLFGRRETPNPQGIKVEVVKVKLKGWKEFANPAKRPADTGADHTPQRTEKPPENQ